MKRTTISLPDNLAAALDREARRLGVPVSQVAREAIEARLGRGAGRRKLPFASLGRSGQSTISRDVEEILRAEWGFLIAIVDAGPLYAAADDDDQYHARCLAVLERGDLEIIVPAFVVAEVAYLIGTRIGSTAEAAFLRGLSAVEVEAPSVADWPAIADLVERYGDFPLGGTDASVAVLAQRLGTDLIVTLDRQHFGVVRMSDGRPFRLLPD